MLGPASVYMCMLWDDTRVHTKSFTTSTVETTVLGASLPKCSFQERKALHRFISWWALPCLQDIYTKGSRFTANWITKDNNHKVFARLPSVYVSCITDGTERLRRRFFPQAEKHTEHTSCIHFPSCVYVCMPMWLSLKLIRMIYGFVWSRPNSMLEKHIYQETGTIEGQHSSEQETWLKSCSGTGIIVV